MSDLVKTIRMCAKTHADVDCMATAGVLTDAADEIDALAARVAELEKVARAADILAHDIPPGDNRAALTRYWAARGGESKCTVCTPDADGAEHGG